MPTERGVDTEKVKRRLVAAGGRLAHEFGFNRTAGEVLASLYLTNGEASLDELEAELHLSKAAVSLAATQLDRLGLVHRIRRPGDRKRYYRSADDIGTALQHGILKFASARMAALQTELQEAESLLKQAVATGGEAFLRRRVARLNQLNQRASRLIKNPLVKLFSKLG
ncbi:MAG: MarR family transcriptional regulator [Verrucomicrobia bacterium]|nr:MarR family transcriptional regulator [Kiritimatiellia bacterium]MCO6401119.1 MarR family transcriptional regulator [Verrucomicrobiota bacterium]